MALVDIVKWDNPGRQVVWKFPSSNLRLGTQLVVKPGQCAIFVSRGKICDVVEEGAVTLTTGNIPLLTALISLPFGGDTPFQAEVWFVNKTTNLDAKWGTPNPVQFEEPKYGLVLPVRAFGQFGFSVTDPRRFLETVVGANVGVSDDDIRAFFRGKMVSTVSSMIGELLSSNVSLFSISQYLEPLSAVALGKLGNALSDFGISLSSFFFESINIPEDDPSYVRLREIKEKAAELNVVGKDIYQLDRAMDVLKTGAGNEGLLGLMTQSHLGAGMGMMLGAQLGQQVGSAMSVAQGQPFSVANPATHAPNVNSQSEIEYFVALNGKQGGPFSVPVLAKLVELQIVKSDTLVWKQGMSSWTAAMSIVELSSLLQTNGGTAPPPIPSS